MCLPVWYQGNPEPLTIHRIMLETPMLRGDPRFWTTSSGLICMKKMEHTIRARGPARHKQTPCEKDQTTISPVNKGRQERWMPPATVTGPASPLFQRRYRPRIQLTPLRHRTEVIRILSPRRYALLLAWFYRWLQEDTHPRCSARGQAVIGKSKTRTCIRP